MDVVAGLVVLGLAVLGAYWLYSRLRERLRARPASGHVVEPPAEDGPVARYQRLARELGQDANDLDTLGRNERFRAAVHELASPSTPVDVAMTLARSTEFAVAALGLTALAERDTVPQEWTDRAISYLRRCPQPLEPLVFRTLVRHASHPVIGSALSQIDEGIQWDALAEFIAARRKVGEVVDVEMFRRNVARRLAEDIERFVDTYEEMLGEGFRQAFEEWRATTVDTEFLTRLARVWERPFDVPPALLVGRRRELVEMALEALEQTPRRSILLVGEPGVGKTTLARTIFARLPSSFIVFEATASQVNAGAMYVGELEGRVSELASRLRSHRAVWLVPRFEETLYAGQHSRSPQGMFDSMLPFVDTGDLTIVGEITPTAMEQLLAERPAVAASFDIVRVRPLDETESIQVARHALEEDALDVAADDTTLTESFDLAQQFLPGVAAPGNLLRLVNAAAAEAAEAGRRHFDTTDVLGALAASSGLPLAMLDPEQPLQLDEVRAFFSERILGQPEAVECVVERIAMAKAGLTDPTRPLGVFLFVGPTGTGKTEIAKALAEFMFGSPARLIRLDMSEYQTPDSLERLLADSSTERRGANFISAVRKEPFAVILLDEFEKAAAPIWDLFLQVFDDGRLTDQRGRVADFRRCIIIATSNVGSSIATSRGVGFAPGSDEFRSSRVEEAVKKSFRPEFLNRIDRVVVFRPFERAQMRALLEKELREAIQRRGLRSRPWAVEVDEPAYEFLIERGFTPDLGARPLKRAVEQHLLAPIAAAIVEHRVPAGDQFLLVSAPGGKRIDVTFVDPDAEEPETVERAESDGAGDVRSIALAGRAERPANRVLLDELHRVTAGVREFEERKRAGLEAINEQSFWDDPGRFETLSDVEYLDRLEAALVTADRLSSRLAHQNGRRATDLAAMLAVRLHVLARAVEGLHDGAPQRVFLAVRAARGGEEAAEALAAMYHSWAERRGMWLNDLPGEPHLCAISGLGCGEILWPERGLHIFESSEDGPSGGSQTQRAVARVEVGQWPAGPSMSDDAVASLARGILEVDRPPDTVVRHYRAQPSPLVRDETRGYRTGRLDRVLAGDFDLF
jgi:ATP-dependent Clp protease ATP-binding subunit ClpC